MAEVLNYVSHLQIILLTSLQMSEKQVISVARKGLPEQHFGDFWLRNPLQIGQWC